MTDNTELKRLADSIHGPGSTMQMLARWREFESACEPKLILALIAEIEALKGPHDWLAEDLIKELVDNAQAIQENADDGEDDPFVIVLLASASRIRRQEANIDKLRAENERLKAENAGLKTGYEAYEQVNAELKAEVEGLRKDSESYRLLSFCHGQGTLELVRSHHELCAEIRRLKILAGEPVPQTPEEFVGPSPEGPTARIRRKLAALGQGEQS